MPFTSSATSTRPASHFSGGLRLRAGVGLGRALLAGLLTFGLIQSFHPVFRVPKEFDVPIIGMPSERFAAHRREQDRVDRWHAMLYNGALGLLIATALGLGEPALRRWWLQPIIVALLGALGGAIGGPLGCAVYEYVRANVGQADLSHTVAAQLLLSVPLGLGVGLGLGISTHSVRGIAKTALAGLAAGLLAGLLYPVAISVLLPEASTDTLLPDEWPGRLLWLGITSGVLGVLISMATRPHEAAVMQGRETETAQSGGK